MVGLPCPEDMDYIAEQARIQRIIAQQKQKEQNDGKDSK